MTAPAEPTPGAPAVPAPSQAPAPAGTPPAPPSTAPGPDPSEPVDVTGLPANVQKLIKTLRDENAKSRTDSKGAAALARKEMAAQVAKALGLGGDEPLTPEQLSAQLEQARDAQWAAAVELQLLRHAPSAEVAEKLLDSRSFIDSLDDLAELDPNSAEFKTALQAKVQEAAAKYPASTPPAPGATNGPRPDPSQGTRGTPATARPTSLGEAVRQHYASR